MKFEQRESYWTLLKYVIWIILALLMMTGCETYDGPEVGRVVGHEYDDPDTYTTMQCYSYSSQGTCTLQMPVTHEEGPHWYLVLEGEGRRDSWEVPEITYNEVREGQWFDTTTNNTVLR